MTSSFRLPKGGNVIFNPSQLTAELARGLQPFCPFIQFALSDGILNLCSPVGSSFIKGSNRQITLLPEQQVAALLLAQGDHVSLGPAYLVLNYGNDRHAFRVIEFAQDIPLAQLATWMGWPDVVFGGRRRVWPKSIADALTLRCNDYWIARWLTELIEPIDVAAKTANALNVSVVVPCRNVAGTLPITVESIRRSASHLPVGVTWECIVVDDASTEPVVLNCVSRNVRLVRSNTQLHCSGARNLGAAVAGNQLLVFCDADTVLPDNYLLTHWLWHAVAPNLITVSMRRYCELHAGGQLLPILGKIDSRIRATYDSSYITIPPLSDTVTISPLEETRGFRDFGYGAKHGPADLPFMVKGHNMCIRASFFRLVRFPDDFIGWGPEDVCFAAKCIARGAYIVPVTRATVRHIEHPVRSGSKDAQNTELRANLARYSRHLTSSPYSSWYSH